MTLGDDDNGIRYEVAIDVDSGAMVARSPLLDPVVCGVGRTVEVINVDPDDVGTGWTPSPFQLDSWYEYLNSQQAVRESLEAALAVGFADRIAVGGGVWATFSADTVVLPDNGCELATRDERRALLERFRTDPADVERELDAQEALSARGRRSAYDVLLHVADDDAVWIVRFRDGELVALSVEG